MGVDVRAVVRWHPPLVAFAALMATLGVVSLVGYVVDDRVLLGVSVWAKPLKFAISFAVYALTLAWMVEQVRRSRLRTVGWWTGAVLAVASTLEMGAIVLQAVRGRQSHFNVSTPFDGLVYQVMGATVAVIYVCTIVLGVLLLRRPWGDAALTWALRLGLALSVTGMSVGFLMVRPRSDQLAQADPDRLGAHSVGAADGGASLPLVGWSTTAGDLRVPHFLGMHALQALPLLALGLLVLPAGRMNERTRLHVVLLAAGVYAAAFALTLWQALRGQSLVHPDGLTLGAVGVVALVAVAAAVALAALRSRSAPAADASRPAAANPTSDRQPAPPTARRRP